MGVIDTILKIVKDVPDSFKAIDTFVDAIKTKTDAIDWSNITDITGFVSSINWTDIGTIITSTGVINWTDIGTIITAVGNINWSDITTIVSAVANINWPDITAILSALNPANFMTAIGSLLVTAILEGVAAIGDLIIAGVLDGFTQAFVSILLNKFSIAIKNILTQDEAGGTLARDIVEALGLWMLNGVSRQTYDGKSPKLHFVKEKFMHLAYQLRHIYMKTGSNL